MAFYVNHTVVTLNNLDCIRDKTQVIRKYTMDRIVKFTEVTILTNFELTGY